jgi:hypothetical protein
MSAAADSSSPVDEAVHVTAIMASATRALAIERFGIFGSGRGVFDRLIAGDAAISAASSVSAARLARMALRTWIVDRWLLQVSPSCTQVVLLGAGLDARCMCVPLAAGTRVFELDLPVVMSLKSQVLPSTSLPHVTRVRLALPSLNLRNNSSQVSCDLSHPSWAQLLQQAGFQRQPTAWLCEGTAMYPITIFSAASPCNNSSRLLHVPPSRRRLLHAAPHATAQHTHIPLNASFNAATSPRRAGSSPRALPLHCLRRRLFVFAAERRLDALSHSNLCQCSG